MLQPVFGSPQPGLLEDMSGNLAGACSACSRPKAGGQGQQEIEAGWSSRHGGRARGSVQLEEPEWLLGGSVCLACTKPSCPRRLVLSKDFQSHGAAWAGGASLVG